MPQKPEEIFNRFVPGEKISSLEELNKGLINKAFVLTSGKGEKYLLHRINSQVFKDPIKLSHNYNILNRYIKPELHELHFPRVYYANSFLPFYKDDNDIFWRLTEYVENTVSYNHFDTPGKAFEAAKAFGIFQQHLFNLPSESLYVAISGFRNMNMRVRALKSSIKRNVKNRKQNANAALNKIIALENINRENHQLIKSGMIKKKFTHNDPKPDNVLFDVKTGKARAVIDLDTVMHGYIIYDFGDLIRSFCSTLDENSTEVDKVRIEPEKFEAASRGYLSQIKENITSADREHLSFGVKVIIYMQAVRFLTDYLNGDIYYKTDYPEHNLDRCHNQIQLLDSYFKQEKQLQKTIDIVLKDKD